MRPANRVTLYVSLAQLLDAGIPGGILCDTLRKSFTHPHAQRLIRAIDARMTAGEPISNAFSALPELVPVHHAQRLKAAEAAGKAPAELRELAADEESQIKLKNTLIAKSTYPVALLHMLLLTLLATPGLGTGTPAMAYLATVALIDVTLFGLWRVLFPNSPDATPSAVLRLIPALHRTVLDAEYAHYLRILERLYEAGIPIATAARQALSTLTNQELSNRLSTAVSILDSHRSMADALQAFPALRPELTALLTTAESAGELGDALRRAAALSASYAEAGSTRFVRVVGGLLYALAAGMVAQRVISFYSAYFSLLR